MKLFKSQLNYPTHKVESLNIVSNLVKNQDIIDVIQKLNEMETLSKNSSMYVIVSTSGSESDNVGSSYTVLSSPRSTSCHYRTSKKRKSEHFLIDKKDMNL